MADEPAMPQMPANWSVTDTSNNRFQTKQKRRAPKGKPLLKHFMDYPKDIVLVNGKPDFSRVLKCKTILATMVANRN